MGCAGHALTEDISVLSLPTIACLSGCEVRMRVEVEVADLQNVGVA